MVAAAAAALPAVINADINAPPLNALLCQTAAVSLNMMLCAS